jgi:hypothetical protein
MVPRLAIAAASATDHRRKQLSCAKGFADAVRLELAVEHVLRARSVAVIVEALHDASDRMPPDSIDKTIGA